MAHTHRPFARLLALGLSFLVLQTHPAGAQATGAPRVSSDIQIWADANRNGVLEKAEGEALTAATTRLLQDPHRVATPLDRMFDLDNDGTISPDEVMRARTVYFRELLVNLQDRNPEAARALDVNDNGRVEEGEAQLVTERLFFEPRAAEPRAAESPVDRRIDANRDRRVTTREFEEFRARVVLAVAVQPFELQRLRPPEPGMARQPQPMGYLDELADLNQNGRVDPGEAEAREQTLRGPHPATTPLDRKIDTNRNNRVDQEEIRVVRETAEREDTRRAEDRRVAEREAAERMEREAAGAQPATRSADPATATNQTAISRAPQPTATAPASALELADVVLADVFPVFRTYYDTNAVGKAVLKNTGTLPIESISVSLNVKEYMTDPKVCKGPDRLDAGAQGEVELYALFTRSILTITEETKAQAAITVTYTVGGQAKTLEVVQTMGFRNRNAMTWDDDRRAAAFVTKNADAVKQFLGTTISGAGIGSTSPLDKNLLAAIAIHEAIGLYGLRYWTDPTNAYETITATAGAADQLRFPEETLRFKTGDCDDLSILRCALMEAAAVKTAFVTVPGHIYVAFALTTTAEESRRLYSKPDELIYQGTTAWVPVEVTNIGNGFLKAWEEGAKEWRENEARGEAKIYPLEDAWKLYPPTDYTAGVLNLTMPADAAVAKAYGDQVRAFVAQETATRVASIQADAARNPGKPLYPNKIGVLYARYGLMDDAEKQFTQAISSGEYAPALLNLGNLAYLEADHTNALGFYERARKADAANAMALLGVARANHALENYGTAKQAYDALKAVSETLAAQFTYLTLRGTEASRAADAGQVKGLVYWGEE